jgi:hypothetical protein
MDLGTGVDSACEYIFPYKDLGVQRLLNKVAVFLTYVRHPACQAVSRNDTPQSICCPREGAMTISDGSRRPLSSWNAFLIAQRAGALPSLSRASW